MTGDVRLGISGWVYDGWRGAFYPDGLAQRRQLEYASHKLSSIEINGSFYSLQRPESYARWHAETPDDFVFSVKAPKFITHVRKLRDVRGPIANFFASGVLALGKKLGPVLWQFAPFFRLDLALFEEFLALLPKDAEGALASAREHDAWMKDRSYLEIAGNRPVRHAIEIRHHSFVTEEFVALLRRHGVAIVVADTAGKWPLLEDVTSDFLYLRLHGDEALYENGYTDEALDRWATRIETWAHGNEPADAHRAGGADARTATGRDVYCYFDNDAKARAPADAQRLAERLGIDWAGRVGAVALEAPASARTTKRAAATAKPTKRAAATAKPTNRATATAKPTNRATATAKPTKRATATAKPTKRSARGAPTASPAPPRRARPEAPSRGA